MITHVTVWLTNATYELTDEEADAAREAAEAYLGADLVGAYTHAALRSHDAPHDRRLANLWDEAERAATDAATRFWDPTDLPYDAFTLHGVPIELPPIEPAIETVGEV